MMKYAFSLVVTALLLSPAVPAQATPITYNVSSVVSAFNPVTGAWECKNIDCPGAPLHDTIESTLSLTIMESSEPGALTSLGARLVVKDYLVRQGDVVLTENGGGVSDVLRFVVESQCPTVGQVCDGTNHYQFISDPSSTGLSIIDNTNTSIKEALLSFGFYGAIYVAGGPARGVNNNNLM